YFFLQLSNHFLELALLLSDDDFQLLNFLVFLKELIKQHSVDLFVTNGVRLTLLVTSHQMGSHFSHFLGYEAKGKSLRAVLLFVVAKAYRSKTEDHFTCHVDWLDIMFKAPR